MALLITVVLLFFIVFGFYLFYLNKGYINEEYVAVSGLSYYNNPRFCTKGPDGMEYCSTVGKVVF